MRSNQDKDATHNPWLGMAEMAYDGEGHLLGC
jgi:hypothetical protein